MDKSSKVLFGPSKRSPGRFERSHGRNTLFRAEEVASGQSRGRSQPHGTALLGRPDPRLPLRHGGLMGETLAKRGLKNSEEDTKVAKNDHRRSYIGSQNGA